MENKAMSDSYCEALAYIIITQAQALDDKIKAGAFITLFFQGINKKYGEAALTRVIREIKKELTPEALHSLGYNQPINKEKGTGIPLWKQSPFLQLLRNNLIKRKQQQAKLKKKV